jgi:hypothetical protein
MELAADLCQMKLLMTNMTQRDLTKRKEYNGKVLSQ